MTDLIPGMAGVNSTYQQSTLASASASASKHETMVNVTAVSPSEEHSSDRTPLAKLSWKTDLREHFPWVGLACLVVIVLSTVATLLVLCFSHEKAASFWCGGKIAPNVLVSLFNNITNIFITIAVTRGIAIAWWRRALSKHTVKDLHYSWSFSSNPLRAFLKPKHFSVIAIGAFAAKVTFFDSTLYQQSLSTYVGYTNPNDTSAQRLAAFASRRFAPTGFFGNTLNEDGYVDQDTFVLTEYYWKKYNGVVLTNLHDLLQSDCQAETCEFGLPAAGFSVSCTRSSDLVDWGLDAKAAMTSNQSAKYQNITIASTYWWLEFPTTRKNYSNIMLNFTYPTTQVQLDYTDTTDLSFLPPANGSCPGTLTTMTCEFRPALLNYTMFVTNRLSDTRLDQSKHIRTSTNRNSESNRQGDRPGNIDNLNTFTQLGYSCDYNSLDWCALYNSTWKQLAGIEVLSNNDIVESFVPGGQSILQGFFLALKATFDYRVSATYNGSVWSTDESGRYAPLAYLNTPPHQFCDFDVADYWLSDIVNQVNMLTISAAADPSVYYPYSSSDWDKLSTMSLDEQYKTTYNLSNPRYGFDSSTLTRDTYKAIMTYKDVYYKTRWAYAGGAVAATFVIVLCIVPVYYGFWQVKRKVTLSPFEIAHAFQSPAFASVEMSDGHLDELLKAAGRTTVQYGEVVDANGKKFVFQQVV